MKRVLTVLILSAVFIGLMPSRVSALSIAQRVLTACDSIVVTDNSSYVENFDTDPECWNLNSGNSPWSFHSTGYIYHNFGDYLCHAITPVLDISAVTNPYLRFSQRRPNFMDGALADELYVFYRNMTEGADTSWILLRAYTNYLNTWTLDSLPLPQGMARIQFKFTALGMGENANGCYLDNVCVYNLPSQFCYPVEQLTLVDVTGTSATISWFGISDTGYHVRYKGVLDSAWISAGTTQATNIQINGLMPATHYTVEVAAICDSMRYVAFDFTTSIRIENLPYYTDFSNVTPDEWELNNGNCHNRWMIGNPVNIPVSSALFVSYDSSSARYNNNFFSVVTARKVFNTGNSDMLRVSFDVQVGGESYFDYLKVFVAPADVEYPASTSATSYGNYNYSVNALDFSDYLSQTGFSSYPYKLNLTNGDVLHVEKNVENPVPGGQVQLVFLWRNDDHYGSQPSAMVTNVFLREMLCHAPTNLTAAIVTSQSATFVWDSIQGANGYILQYKPASLSWDNSGVITVSLVTPYYQIPNGLSPNTDYDVRVATNCGADTSLWTTTTFTTICGVLHVTEDLPYEEHFNTAPVCWNLNAGLETWPYESSAGQLHHPYGTYNCSAISPILDVHAVAVPMLRFSQKRPDYNGSAIADHMSVYYRSVHASDTGWHLLKSYTSYMNVWTEDSLMLPSGLMDIQLRFTVNGMGYNADGAYLDNVMVYAGSADYCPPVSNFAVSNVTDSSALVTWMGFNGNGFDVRYKKTEDTTWTVWGITQNYQAHLTNLLPGTHYVVEVSTVCDDMEYSSLNFTTKLVPATLPFFTDFSDVSEGDWQFNNGTCVNRWYIGTPNISSGDNALFVSADGVNAQYNTSSYSIVSAMKLFEAGQSETFKLSFDVTAGGEGHYDYLKVFLAPENRDYPAATEGTTYAASNYSEYAADFTNYIAQTGYPDFVYKLNLTHGLMHVTLEMPNPAPNGRMKLVFLWRNDDGGGSQPSVAISNVLLKEQNCHKPTNLVATGISSTSAVVDWIGENETGNYILQYKPVLSSWNDTSVVSLSVVGTAYPVSGLIPNTEYEVRVATDCGTDTSTWSSTTFTTACGIIVVTDDIPFEEDFSVYPTCWDLTSGSSVWKYSEQDQYIYHNYGYYTCDAITPVLDISAVTNPYVICSHIHQDHAGSGITDSVKVYYRTSPSAQWVLIHACTGPVYTWSVDSIALPNPSSAYQIKFTAVGMGDDANGCVLNDIFVRNLPLQDPEVVTMEAQDVTFSSATLRGSVSNPDNVNILTQGFEWKAASDASYTQVPALGNTMTYELSGLTGNTDYTFHAFVTTANGMITGQEMPFTTLPQPEPCETPTGLQATQASVEGIYIIWEDNEEVMSWNIQYRPEGGIITSATSTINSYVIQDVVENSSYIIRVQAVCDENESSEWSDSIIVTPIGVVDYPGNSLVVYPNPTQESLNVQITHENLQVKEMEICDVYGKVVSVTETPFATSLQTRINVSGLANGVYFVRVITEQGVLTKPFVKQ